MTAMLLPMLLLLAAGRAEPARAIGEGGAAGWFSSDDYPKEAIVQGAEGVTAVRLTVDPNGKVSDCKVTGSSGFASLDDTTCSLFRARGNFIPAHDRRGRPTTDSTSIRIRWVLPEGSPGFNKPWREAVRARIAPDGAILSCSEERTGNPVIGSGGCAGLTASPVSRRLAFRSGAGAGPADILLVSAWNLGASTAAAGEPGRLVALSSARVRYAPGEKLCTTLREEGPPEIRLPLCTLIEVVMSPLASAGPPSGDLLDGTFTIAISELPEAS
ncbi:MAG: energy transducer TonB [Alphaproteobacteria bacterium]|nr:MAG: energy transducer TonB [Alphaproteobacteria bacterium]